MINVWNSLLCDITNFSSVKAFKRSLGAIDLSGFCTGSFQCVFAFSIYVFVFISLYFILQGSVKHYNVSLTVLPHAGLHVIVTLMISGKQ